MRLYPGGHPSSYNSGNYSLTWNSVVKGNALTESGIRVPKRANSSRADIKLLGATLKHRMHIFANLVTEDIKERALASTPVEALFCKQYVNDVTSAVSKNEVEIL